MLLCLPSCSPPSSLSPRQRCSLSRHRGELRSKLLREGSLRIRLAREGSRKDSLGVKLLGEWVRMGKLRSKLAREGGRGDSHGVKLLGKWIRTGRLGVIQSRLLLLPLLPSRHSPLSRSSGLEDSLQLLEYLTRLFLSCQYQHSSLHWHQHLHDARHAVLGCFPRRPPPIPDPNSESA